MIRHRCLTSTICAFHLGFGLDKKPPELRPPTASETTRESNSLVAKRNRSTTKPNSTIPKSGYGFLEALLSTLKGHSAALAAELEKNHKKRGRKGYPALGKLCALTLQYLFNERYSSYFLADLDGNPRLLSMCGLDKAPSEPTFSKFKKQLAGCLPLLDQIFNKVVEECGSEIERLRDAGIIAETAPPLGEMLAMDATDIEAYAKPISEHCDDPEQWTCTKKHKTHCDSPVPEKCTKHSEKPCADPDARWGYRTPKRRGASSASSNADEESKELFFGYKAHAVADAYYQLPLHVTLRPANKNEGPYFAEDLDAALARHQWLKPKAVMADKGYDALSNFEHVLKRRIIPIIAVRRPPKDKKTGERRYDGLYDKDGRPVCVGGKPMTYLGTDPEGAHHFRGPAVGCQLKNKIDWSRYCNSQHSEKPEGKLLRIMGLVPRSGKLWKKWYKMRTAIERYFSSGKRSRLMDSHRYFEQGKIHFHTNISALAYLLTALTHLKAGDYKSMRHMNIRP